MSADEAQGYGFVDAVLTVPHIIREYLGAIEVSRQLLKTTDLFSQRIRFNGEIVAIC